MKDHPENSPKFLTTSIKNLKDWEDLREKITFIFEVFGKLNHQTKNKKNNVSSLLTFSTFDYLNLISLNLSYIL
jgi:hypothetical protein